MSLENLKNKVLALNAELKENFEKELKAEVKTLFNKYPLLEEFNFPQYTPYFNDGDPCEFRMCIDEPGFTYNGYKNECYDSVFHWKTGEFTSDEASKAFSSKEEAKNLVNDINNFVSNLQDFEKQMQTIIGEGLVVFTRNGIEVEEYDHD